ncbi:MAG: FkbM family methyltransferase [Rhodoferax sp.]|nr:FkbM family methyltransferase [Rhodoferax sp.]
MVVNDARTININAYIEHALALYNETITQRADRLRSLYGNNLDAVIPWNGAGHAETYLWDFFPPSFNCPFKYRLGRLSDGGKVVCNWETLRDKCATDPHAAAIYSVGVRGDISFETDLVQRTGCAVHAFDHTEVALPEPVPGITFAQIGLAPTDSPLLLSLPTLMAQRGHTRIDLLKIDCEGCEWAVFDSLNATGVLPSIDQLSIELHFAQAHTNNPGPTSGVRDVLAFFEAMESAGLYPFSWEVNHNAGASRMMPWVIEYSFVRARSRFMTDEDAWQRVDDVVRG